MIQKIFGFSLCIVAIGLVIYTNIGVVINKGNNINILQNAVLIN